MICQSSLKLKRDQMEYQNLEGVIKIIAKLRDPKGGCPWDLNQTHESLLKYLIEECYEYIHAVEQKDTQMMEEELGDILLQVLLHTQIASEVNHFTLDSVAKVLSEKMIHRHPHVFKDKSIAKNEEQVMENWRRLKKEKKGIPPYHIMTEDAYAPSLLAAMKIGEKSKSVNFDWIKVDDVLAKVEEEMQEVKDEMFIENNQQKIKEEIGDLLFSVAQLARHLNINPEEALKEANFKFIKRINLVEDKVKADGKSMENLSTEELEKIWQKIKKSS